jgi:hypothetical protein
VAAQFFGHFQRPAAAFLAAGKSVAKNYQGTAAFFSV